MKSKMLREPEVKDAADPDAPLPSPTFLSVPSTPTLTLNARVRRRKENGGDETICDTLALLGEFSGFATFTRDTLAVHGSLHFHYLSAWNKILTFTPVLGFEPTERKDAECLGSIKVGSGWIKFNFGREGNLDVLPGDGTLQKVFSISGSETVRWDFTLLPQGGKLTFLLRELSRG